MAQTISVPGVGDLEFPDGMSQQDMAAAIQKNFPQIHDQPKAPPVKEPTMLESAARYAGVIGNAGNKAVAGIPDMLLNTPNNLLNLGKAAYGLGVGALGGKAEDMPALTPNPDFAHKALTAGKFIQPGFEPQNAKERAVDAVTQGAVGMAVSPASSLRQGVTNTAIGGASGLASNATNEATGNTALSITAGMATPWAAGKVIQGAQNKMQDLGAKQEQNAVRDANTQAAIDAGLKISPIEANPSFANKFLTGIAGKLTTRQLASEKNAATVNSLAREAGELPPNMPLSRDNIASARVAAGQPYEALKQYGSFRADLPFLQEANGISAGYRQFAKEFPSLANNGIDEVVASLSKPRFSSEGTIEAIKALRADGSAALASAKISGEPGQMAVGKAKLAAANALENLIERNLAQTNSTKLLTDFQEARPLIAKLHEIEAAVNPASTNIDARKLGKSVMKGKPLSSGLDTIGETALQYPYSMKPPESVGGSPGFSPLDLYGGMGAGTIVGGMGALASGHGHTASGLSALAAGAAVPLARVGARKLLMSDVYQNNMLTPDYNSNFVVRGLASAAPGDGAANAALSTTAPVRGALNQVRDHGQ